MRVQIEDQRLRWRVSAEECTQLLGGASLLDHTNIGTRLLQRQLRLQPAGASLSTQDDCLTLSLPHADVVALAARLPSRDGLHYTVGAVEIEFDVDVRSARA